MKITVLAYSLKRDKRSSGEDEGYFNQTKGRGFDSRRFTSVKRSSMVEHWTKSPLSFIPWIKTWPMAKITVPSTVN